MTLESQGSMDEVTHIKWDQWQYVVERECKHALNQPKQAMDLGSIVKVQSQATTYQCHEPT